MPKRAMTLTAGLSLLCGLFMGCGGGGGSSAPAVIPDVDGDTSPPPVDSPPPVAVSTQSPFFSGTKAKIVGTQAPVFDFSPFGNEEMLLSINGATAIFIAFEDAQFADPANATLTEVIDSLNLDFAASGVGTLVMARASTGSEPADRVVLETNRTGSSQSLDITDSSGNPSLILGLTTAPVSGTQSPADENSELNDLTCNLVDLLPGDMIVVMGTKPDGVAVLENFLFGDQAGQDGITLGDLRDFVNVAFDHQAQTGAECAIQPSGNMRLAANATPTLDLWIRLEDLGPNGEMDWASHAFTVFEY